MKKTYQLIALDMDGTVLNSKKQIDEPTKKAIHQALAAGKEVVFCTGRSYAEMEKPLEEFPDMHYLCGESGALIYDIPAKKTLHAVTIQQDAIDAIIDAVKDSDFMPHMMHNGDSYVNASQIGRMDHYQMGIYMESFKTLCTVVDDLVTLQKTEKMGIEKFNVYNISKEQQAENYNKIKALNLPVETVYSEIASLENTPKGIDKAYGLEWLCGHLGITMDQVIMVGDADNDLPAIHAAGLGVAMGNANENVKAASDVITDDNDHNGCASVIYQYLMDEA